MRTCVRARKEKERIEMKKFLAVILAVLMVLSLSACGKKLSVGDSLQMGND